MITKLYENYPIYASKFHNEISDHKYNRGII